MHYEEIERLIAEIPNETESDLRDRAIIELLFSSGLRVSELVGLNRGNINTKRREFTVRGKETKTDQFLFRKQTSCKPISKI